ncbi:MAG: hypothetical protein PHT12_03095 [Patescibacteria group bacterium]|nr:hypothetical protein [Patescibacteria group bacterium]
MRLFIDEGGSEPIKSFFISTPTAVPNDWLSFDWTSKGHRVLIQRLVETGVKTPDHPADAEWNTLIIEDGKLAGKEHCVWFDFDTRDLVNDEMWEQIQEWPLDADVAEKMLDLTRRIRLNPDDVDLINHAADELENLIRPEAKRLGVVLA